MGRTVGTPRFSAVIRPPDPWTQSAELQIVVGPSLITTARKPGPTLNEHSAACVETTLRLKLGGCPGPKLV